MKKSTITIMCLISILVYPVRICQAQKADSTTETKNVEMEAAIAAEKRKADIIYKKIDVRQDSMENLVSKLPAKKAIVVKPKIQYVTRYITDTVYYPRDTCITIAQIEPFIMPPLPPPVKVKKFKRFIRNIFHPKKQSKS